MESPQRDGQNKLAKTIKDQNLKFSVEFDNGEVAGHADKTSVTSVLESNDDGSALNAPAAETNAEESSNTWNFETNKGETITEKGEVERPQEDNTTKTPSTVTLQSEVPISEQKNKTKAKARKTTNERHRESQESEKVIKKETTKSKNKVPSTLNKNPKLPPIIDSNTSPRESRGRKSKFYGIYCY